MKLLVNESQKFDIKCHEDYMRALFVNKETIKQVVLLHRPAIGWTTKYIDILCILIRITWSSSNRLDDQVYQYTLHFNIYYFVVQPRLDDWSK